MLQFPHGQCVENDEIQGQRFNWVYIGCSDIYTQPFDYFRRIMLDSWVWSWRLALNWIDNYHPIDLEPVKEDEQLSPLSAYRVLSVPFLLGERANGAAMNTHSGCFAVRSEERRVGKEGRSRWS